MSIKSIFIILGVLLCSIETFSQSNKTPTIPVKAILDGFKDINSLRAKLLEMGFVFNDEKKTDEESWALYLEQDEKSNEYLDSRPHLKKFTTKVLCDILTINEENKIIKGVFVHIRHDFLPYYKKEMQQNIKSYFPYTRVKSVSTGYGTPSQKNSFELQYYSDKNAILINIMDMDEQWVIIRFLLKD